MQCENCGTILKLTEGSNRIKCDYCGMTHFIINQESYIKAEANALIERGNILLKDYKFKKQKVKELAEELVKGRKKC